ALHGGGREEVKLRIHLAGALRHFDVDSESVEEVAAPFQRLAIGLEKQSGEIGHRAVGSVLAGNPLWGVENQVAGRGGDLQRGVEDLAWGVRGVDRESDLGTGGRPRCGGEDDETNQYLEPCSFHYSNPMARRFVTVLIHDYSSPEKSEHRGVPAFRLQGSSLAA